MLGGGSLCHIPGRENFLPNPTRFHPPILTTWRKRTWSMSRKAPLAVRQISKIVILSLCQADILADCQPKRKRCVKTKSKTGKRPATQAKPNGLDPHDVVGSVMSHMDSTFGPHTPQMRGSGISFTAPTQRIPFLAPDDDSAPCSSSRSGMSDEVPSEDSPGTYNAGQVFGW